MELKVKNAIIIPDGEYEGVITNVRYRQKPYEYVDFEIQMPWKEGHADLKVGFPAVVSTASKLGQCMERFGFRLEIDGSVDPDKMIGEKCKFKTFSEKKQNGTFVRIEADSFRKSIGTQKVL